MRDQHRSQRNSQAARDGRRNAGGGRRNCRRADPRRLKPLVAGGRLFAVLDGNPRFFPGQGKNLSDSGGARIAQSRSGRRKTLRSGYGKRASAPGVANSHPIDSDSGVADTSWLVLLTPRTVKGALVAIRTQSLSCKPSPLLLLTLQSSGQRLGTITHFPELPLHKQALS